MKAGAPDLENRFAGIEIARASILVNIDRTRFRQRLGGPRISRRASREPAHRRSLRVGSALARAGARCGRQVRAGNRKALLPPRRGLSSSERYNRRLFHVSHRTRHAPVIVKRRHAERSVFWLDFIPVNRRSARCKRNILGVGSEKPHPSHLLNKCFREAGPHLGG